jgi:uncharacterized membrane protein YbhN (UPF0104 family)
MASLRASISRRAEYALVVSAALFLAAAAAMTAAGGGELWAQLGHLSGATMTALLGLSLLNYAVRCLRWHLYSRHLGVDVSARFSALVYVTGFAFTATPGRIGELLRLWVLERIAGQPYGRTAPLALADRLSDLAAVALLLLAGLAAATPDPVLVGFAVGAIVGVAALVLWPGLGSAAVLAAYRTAGRWPRLFAKLRTIARNTAGLFSPRLALAGLSLALAGWAAECLAFHLLLQALGADIGFLGATLVFTAGMIVGALTVVPGGVGGTEATMVLLLGAQGVPLSLAVPATLVIRVTTLWFAVALGFACLSPTLRAVRRAGA